MSTAWYYPEQRGSYLKLNNLIITIYSDKQSDDYHWASVGPIPQTHPSGPVLVPNKILFLSRQLAQVHFESEKSRAFRISIRLSLMEAMEREGRSEMEYTEIEALDGF